MRNIQNTSIGMVSNIIWVRINLFRVRVRIHVIRIGVMVTFRVLTALLLSHF